MSADPYYPIMYCAALSCRDISSQAWLKKAEIEYLKPARSDLMYQFRLSEEDIESAKNALRETDRFENWNTVEAVDKDGVVCARVRLLSHLKSKR